MISKKDIINMTHHVGRHGNNIPDRKLLHPNREWVLGLLVFLLVTVGGAVYNAYLFNYYASIESSIEANELSPIEYKQPIVTRVIEQYDAKAEALETLYAELASATTTATTTATTSAAIATTSVEVR